MWLDHVLCLCFCTSLKIGMHLARDSPTDPFVFQQDAVQAKGRATAALHQAQQQHAQSGEHLSLLKKQLAEERQSDAALSANLDSVTAELARFRTQV